MYIKFLINKIEFMMKWNLNSLVVFLLDIDFDYTFENRNTQKIKALDITDVLFFLNLNTVDSAYKDYLLWCFTSHCGKKLWWNGIKIYVINSAMFLLLNKSLACHKHPKFVLISTTLKLFTEMRFGDVLRLLSLLSKLLS